MSRKILNLFKSEKRKISQTKIKKSNESLPLTENDFQNIIENLPVMYYSFENKPPHKLLFMSCLFDIFGYSVEEWKNNQKLWTDTIYHKDRRRVLQKIEKALAEDEAIDIEYRVTGKNKQIFWVRNKGCAVKNESGEVVCRQGIIIDVSDQKQTENELKKRENLYRTISRNLPRTGILVFDQNLHFTLAEGEELEKMNLSPENIEGKSLFEVFPREISEEFERYYRAALAGGFISFEREIGDKIILNYVIPLKNEKNEIYAGMSLWQDVTEARRFNEKIRESEQRFREIFDGASDLIYSHDLQGRFLTMNKVAERVFGFTQEEIARLNIREVIAPDQLDDALKMIQAKLLNETKQTVYELDCITKTGERLTLEINSSLIIKDEKPLGVQGIARDITERKRMQLALIESEDRLRNLFENANDLIYLLNLEGKLISVNKAIENLFGYTAEELKEFHFTDFVAPEYAEIAEKMMREKINGKQRTVYEIVCLTKSGQKVTLEVNSSPMIINGKLAAMQGIARDITERKITEKRISDSEAELRALFSAMNDIVLVIDKTGKILRIPQTSLPLPSVTPETILGKKLQEVFSRKMARFFIRHIKKSLTEKNPQRIEYSVEIAENTYWYSANISPISEDSVLIVARDVTDGKLYEDNLKLNEEKYRDLFENANDIIYTVDLKGYFTSLNHAGEKISGYTQSEAINQKIHISQIVAPEFLELAQKKIAEKLAGAETTRYELDFIAKDGKRITVELSTRIIYRDGNPIGVQGIGRDVTDRKQTEEALIYSESRFRHLSEGIMHQVWTAKPNGVVDYINSRGLEYFGEEKERLIGEIWEDVFHPEDFQHTVNRWQHAIETGEKHEVEFRLRRYDGEYRWHRSVATPGRDSEGKIVKWYGTNTDIHDQKIAEAQLSHIAKHDALTNLPNRSKFMSHLERMVYRRKQQKDYLFAVIFLDLDRFKIINDSLGHLIGDKLLIAFAERLESCVRPDDVVARLGGDEFTILLNNLENSDDAVRITNRLIQRLSEPFVLDEYEVFTSASVGIVLADEVQREPKDYLRDADTAMYRAKETGKARYEIFNSEMHVRNMSLLRVENDLRKAIERNEFRVFYQPIVSLETGEIQEFEALIRWQHPEYGMVSPNEFIKVAEETGLIIPIGKMILEESCRQIARWRKKFPQANPFSVGVNLSSKQLMHPNLVSQIKEILEKTKLNPHSLRLEVTESEVMENSEIALTVLNQLKEIGVLLSTDDFGTGYSSLSYLHRFPFDCLKIDRSFIGDMESNNKSAEIVRTILMLAQNLNLEVVAEGIETEEQLGLLQLQGCKTGQGYLFSKPIDALSVEKLLAEKNFGFPVKNSYQFSKIFFSTQEIQ